MCVTYNIYIYIYIIYIQTPNPLEQLIYMWNNEEQEGKTGLG
jgi:hypothetical protein